MPTCIPLFPRLQQSTRQRSLVSSRTISILEQIIYLLHPFNASGSPHIANICRSPRFSTRDPFIPTGSIASTQLRSFTGWCRFEPSLVLPRLFGSIPGRYAWPGQMGASETDQNSSEEDPDS